MSKNIESLPSQLTSSEVCAELRCSEKTLQRWRKDRRITFIRRFGRYLYPRKAIESLLAKRTVVAA